MASISKILLRRNSVLFRLFLNEKLVYQWQRYSLVISHGENTQFTPTRKCINGKKEWRCADRWTRLSRERSKNWIKGAKMKNGRRNPKSFPISPWINISLLSCIIKYLPTIWICSQSYTKFYFIISFNLARKGNVYFYKLRR